MLNKDPSHYCSYIMGIGSIMYIQIVVYCTSSHIIWKRVRLLKSTWYCRCWGFHKSIRIKELNKRTLIKDNYITTSIQNLTTLPVALSRPATYTVQLLISLLTCGWEGTCWILSVEGICGIPILILLVEATVISGGTRFWEEGGCEVGGFRGWVWGSISCLSVCGAVGVVVGVVVVVLLAPVSPYASSKEDPSLVDAKKVEYYYLNAVITATFRH